MHASLSNSPLTMNTGADQNRRSTAAKIRHFCFGETPSDTWLSTAVNCFRTGTAYPPLSFHLIGWLGTPSTFTAMGRWVSLISLMATGIFVSLIVRRAGGSRQTAVFSFLLYVIGIALLSPDRIGMNDPQLLGEALTVAGLYFYFRNPDSNRHLCVSALLFCLAGFTKPNLLAFPAAVAIDLLLRSRRAFATWAGAMVLCAGFLTAVTLLIDGRYFPIHLMVGGGRAYS